MDFRSSLFLKVFILFRACSHKGALMSRDSGGRGMRRGRMGGFTAGPGGSCVCPKCGYTTPHTVGTPCYQQTCPKCGSRMTRGA